VNSDPANGDAGNGDTGNGDTGNGDIVVHTNDSQNIHNDLFLMGHCFSGNVDFSVKYSPGNSQAIFNPTKHWHFSNKPRVENNARFRCNACRIT